MHNKKIYHFSLKKTILISILGHITVFSIFTFSSGQKISKLNYAEVAFLGSFLPSAEIRPFSFNYTISSYKWFKCIGMPEARSVEKTNTEYPLMPPYYLKPMATLGIVRDKINYVPVTTLTTSALKKKEPVIMFYPHLPYHFLLYFKDRQAVHIELMFNIVSNNKTKSIAIKRKISSGNLEADLLSMRYISHYLFVEQNRFTQNNWHNVKIDLSTKYDQY